jgi:long-chain acyl-CoA synthetase
VYPLERYTLKRLLARSLDLFESQPCVGYPGEEPLTYAQFGRRVAEIGAFLEERGIEAGDKVAILGENSPNWAAAFFAITGMGAVAVPILPGFAPAAVQHILRHGECKAIFISERHQDRLSEEQAEEMEAVVLLEDLSVLEQDGRTKVRDALRGAGRSLARITEAARRMARRGEDEEEAPAEDDLATLIYTSGTTGHSKGVMLSHRNVVSNAMSGDDVAKMSTGDRLLSILPLAHTYECTLGLVLPFMKGCHISYLGKPPTPRALLPALEQVRPTKMLCVPLVVEKIFKLRIRPKLSSGRIKGRLYALPPVRRKLHKLAAKKMHQTFGGCLDILAIGGAPLAPEVERFLREGGFPYTVGYGLTECSPLLSGTTPDKARFRSAGPHVANVKLRIADKDPVTGEGEVEAHGPNVMQGYYKEPEMTAELFTEDGWLRTGDLGYMDDDGFLYLRGRSKNLILGPSGENIYPEELEAAIAEHADVLEALVYEDQGRITARIHLDYERLDQECADKGMQQAEVRQCLLDRLEEVRAETNEKLPVHARIQKVIEQEEPFEKTPTHKIKRYLYTA